MGRRTVVAVAVLFFAVFARAERRGAVDWIFLVDTSKSMRGVGGTKNIFPDVKESIAAFVREASDGDSVAIYTFDQDARLHSPSTEIRAGTREDLYTIIDALEANGDRTHLGLAIAKGLERAESLRGRSDPTRVRAVVLFTDGKEDVRGIASPVPISSNVRRVDDSYVFFVSMGDHEPQLDDFASATERTTVLKAPTREAIRDVAREIREKIKPAPPPAPPVITIAPSTIDFGEVILGKSSEARELTITSNKRAHVVLSVVAPARVTMQPVGEVDISPRKPARVRITFDVAEDAVPGREQLLFRAGNGVASGTIGITKPSALFRAAKWLVVVAILAAIAFVAFRNYRRNNQLEGEIEIVQPQVAPDAAFVGLPQLQASEVSLSAIVPVESLGESDARLFVRRKDGAKKVWISAQSGSLRVNDVETPMSELYDADTIQIGDAKLRFNRVGYERPQEEL
jgi:hypothetical protein